jgi:putative FmdB family regulatory protein
MPIYEYRCRNCSRVFEVFTYKSNGAREDCPDCGSADTARLFSAFAVSGGPEASSQAQTPPEDSGCGCGGCTCR